MSQPPPLKRSSSRPPFVRTPSDPLVRAEQPPSFSKAVQPQPTSQPPSQQFPLNDILSLFTPAGAEDRGDPESPFSPVAPAAPPPQQPPPAQRAPRRTYNHHGDLPLRDATPPPQAPEELEERMSRVWDGLETKRGPGSPHAPARHPSLQSQGTLTASPSHRSTLQHAPSTGSTVTLASTGPRGAHPGSAQPSPQQPQAPAASLPPASAPQAQFAPTPHPPFHPATSQPPLVVDPSTVPRWASKDAFPNGYPPFAGPRAAGPSAPAAGSALPGTLPPSDPDPRRPGAPDRRPSDRDRPTPVPDRLPGAPDRRPSDRDRPGTVSAPVPPAAGDPPAPGSGGLPRSATHDRGLDAARDRDPAPRAPAAAQHPLMPRSAPPGSAAGPPPGLGPAQGQPPSHRTLFDDRARQPAAATIGGILGGIFGRRDGAGPGGGTTSPPSSGVVVSARGGAGAAPAAGRSISGPMMAVHVDGPGVWEKDARMAAAAAGGQGRSRARTEGGPGDGGAPPRRSGSGGSQGQPPRPGSAAGAAPAGAPAGKTRPRDRFNDPSVARGIRDGRAEADEARAWEAAAAGADARRPSAPALADHRASTTSSGSLPSPPPGNGIDLSNLPPPPPAVAECVRFVERECMQLEGVYRISGPTGAVAALKRCFDERGAEVRLAPPRGWTGPPAVVPHQHQGGSVGAGRGGRAAAGGSAAPRGGSVGRGGAPDPFEWARLMYAGDPHVVAGVVKRAVADGLPAKGGGREPLATFALYEAFLEAAEVVDYEERMIALQDLVHSLPPAHFAALKFVCEHLQRVARHFERNRMTARNLAIVFAPGILQARWDAHAPAAQAARRERGAAAQPAATVMDEALARVMKDTPRKNTAVGVMIEYADWIFGPIEFRDGEEAEDGAAPGGPVADAVAALVAAPPHVGNVPLTPESPRPAVVSIVGAPAVVDPAKVPPRTASRHPGAPASGQLGESSGSRELSWGGRVDGGSGRLERHDRHDSAGARFEPRHDRHDSTGAPFARAEGAVSRRGSPAGASARHDRNDSWGGRVDSPVGHADSPRLESPGARLDSPGARAAEAPHAPARLPDPIPARVEPLMRHASETITIPRAEMSYTVRDPFLPHTPPGFTAASLASTFPRPRKDGPDGPPGAVPLDAGPGVAELEHLAQALRISVDLHRHPSDASAHRHVPQQAPPQALPARPRVAIPKPRPKSMLADDAASASADEAPLESPASSIRRPASAGSVRPSRRPRSMVETAGWRGFP